MLGDVCAICDAIPEWTFPYSSSSDCEDLSNYDADSYRKHVADLGLEKTWECICKWMLAHGESEFLAIGSLGELYEEGLAIQSKDDKKAKGQYYTPEDVSHVMSCWLEPLAGDALCDVGCGVGNLTLAYLSLIGRPCANTLLNKGRLHLYDTDRIAMCICITSIAVRYGHDKIKCIHAHLGDFLDRRMRLPAGCKVISNPPYAAIKSIPETWDKTEVVSKGMELYSSFMEKIMRQSRSSVIITPYSFIGGEKFYPLRRMMNDLSGFVVSFDNVPGTVFVGRKHGIFNSNTGNSVRAAITVVKKDGRNTGFRFSPLIRFKNIEREKLFSCSALEGFLGCRRQKVSARSPMFAKCDRRLESIYETWLQRSDSMLGMHVGKTGSHTLSMPNTCRYFTVATDEPLSRKGQVTLRFADENVYWYVFCMINSSFAYWHWRLFDGGITYPIGLLSAMPLFYGLLCDEDRRFCRDISRQMIRERNRYVIRKENVGVQENVKYPREFRDTINRRFLQVLGVRSDETVFDVVHSNMALEVNLCET